MWSHYVGRQIRRTSWNLLWTNGLPVVLILVVALLARNYLYNFFFGPFPLDQQTLLQVRSTSELSRYFVTVDSDHVVPKLGQDIRQVVDKQTREVKSETVTAEYVGLVLRGEQAEDDRLLLVRTAGNSPARKSYTGTLTEVPAGVMDKIIDPVEARNPRLRGWMIRTLFLDTTGFRLPGYMGLALGVPMLFFGLWNVGRAIRRLLNPERHPLIASLARLGPPAEVVGAMQEEVAQAAAGASLRRPLATRSWVFQPTFYGLLVVPLAAD